MTKEEMKALAMRLNDRDKERAQMVELFPCLLKMDGATLEAMDLNPEALQLAAAECKANGIDLEAPQMHAKSAAHTMSGWHVVAKEPIKRFFAQLAPLDAFSTTYSRDYVVAGSKARAQLLEVGVYDDSGEASIDNYDNFDTRDSASSSSATVVLHKIDDVVEIDARNIEQGIDPQIIIEAMLSRVAKKVQKYVLSCLAAGTVQQDDLESTGGTGTKAIEAIEVPEIGNADGKFNFGYANQVLSEAIQPEVHAMLVDSAHYGALKPANRDSLTAKDLDVQTVKKIQFTDQLGTNACGLLANKRAVAVGLIAPYFMAGVYSSIQHMTNEGVKCPLTIATYGMPGKNAIKVVAATMVGVTLVDASAVKVLKHTPAAA